MNDEINLFFSYFGRIFDVIAFQDKLIIKFEDIRTI